MVKGLAQTQKVDCWMLLSPLGAISRMMPNAREPLPQLSNQLDRIFEGAVSIGRPYTPHPHSFRSLGMTGWAQNDCKWP